MFTPQFDRYIAPARPHGEIWRLLLGIVTIAGTYLAGLIAIIVLFEAWLGMNGATQLAIQMDEDTSWLGVLLLLPTFIGMALGPVVAAKYIHKRSVATLFGPRISVLYDFTIAAAIVLAAYSGLLVIWSFWFEPLPNLKFTTWLKILPFLLIGLLVQTLAEELVFRSYLQQQLAVRFKSPIIWMLLPSVGFAALHYGPQTLGDNTWLIVGATGLFGLVAADLTRITGSIGAAWGFHFANNLWAVVLIAVDNNLSGAALYVTPYSVDNTSLMPILITGDLIAMIIAWIFLRRLFLR